MGVRAGDRAERPDPRSQRGHSPVVAGDRPRRSGRRWLAFDLDGWLGPEPELWRHVPPGVSEPGLVHGGRRVGRVPELPAAGAVWGAIAGLCRASAGSAELRGG